MGEAVSEDPRGPRNMRGFEPWMIVEKSEGFEIGNGANLHKAVQAFRNQACSVTIGKVRSNILGAEPIRFEIG